MTKRFRILGLVLAVLLLLVPCFVLAEDTMAVTMPKTLKAGEDLVISWTPQEEDQMLTITVSGDNGYESGNYNARKTPLVFKGMQAGTYTVKYTAAGEGYEENWHSETLTVSENSAQPAAPKLTLDGGKAYFKLPVTVLLDQEYDDVSCLVRGPYGNSTEEPQFFGDRFTLWPRYYEDKVTIHVSAKKNGVWSKEAIMPITFEQTPEVSGMTVYNWRDTVVLGEAIHIYVGLPRDEGTVSIESFMGDNEASGINTTGLTPYDGICGLLIPAAGTTNNMVPGEYSVVFTWTKADGSKETVTKALTVTGEKLVPPTIDAVPLNLKAGDSFTLTGQCNGADRIDLIISRSYGDYYYGERGAEILEDGTWRCEMPVLKAGVYRVEASGYSGRLSASSSQRGIVISGADSYPAPTLTRLTGPVSGVNMSLGEGVDLTGKQVTWRIVQEPEYGFGSVYYRTSESADGGIGYHVYSMYAQTYTITAVYEADGMQSLPGQIVLEVTGKPYPVNGPTPMELTAPETVKEGEDLRITLTSSIQDLRPTFSITEKDTDFSVPCTSEWSADRKTLIYTANGYDLTPGEYSIRVTAEANTYEPVRKRYSFTVTENPDRPAVAFTMSPEAPTNIDPVTFTAGKEYDRIAVRTRAKGAADYGQRYVYNHTDSVSVNLSTAGEWEAELTAYDGHVWSLPQTVPVTVAQAAKLAQPVFDSSMTATLEVGQPLQIKVNEIDPHATCLVCDLMPEQWYEPAYHEEVSNLRGSYEVTVPDELLQWSGKYTVKVIVYADGYEEASNSFVFTLTGERPAAPALTFSATSGKTGDVIYATVTAAGATEAELVKSYSWGNGGDDIKSLGVYALKNGSVTIPVNLNFNDSQEFKARVKVGGVWSLWTDRTLIQASERPENLPEDVRLAVWPETLTAGQTVDLELLPAEGISYYRVLVYNDQLYNDFTTNEAGVFTIPGYAVGKGEVTVYVSAGMEHSMPVASESRIYKDVKAAALDPLTIKLNRDEVDYGSEYTVSLVGTQADAIMVISRSQTDREWEQAGFLRAEKGKKLTKITLSATDLSGEVRIRASACVGGKWTDWSNEKIIRVGKNQGVLPNPVPTAAMAGGNLHVSWSAVEGATGYDCVWYNVVKNLSRNQSVTGTELDLPEADLENGEYIICVYSKAPGYARNESCSRVIVTVTLSGDIVVGSEIILPAALKTLEAEALAGVSTEKIVVPAGCESIGAKAFAGCSGLKVVEIRGMNTVVAADAFEGCEEVVVMVQLGSKAEETLARLDNVTVSHLD